MPTFSIGKHPKTSIEEWQDGMQIYKSTTTKSNMSLEKQIYLQMCCHDHPEWTKGKKITDKSRYYPLIVSSMQLQWKKSLLKTKRRRSCY
jgi:ribosomal protein L31